MPDFIYKAKNRSGQSIDGLLQAPTEDQAVITLHQRDLVILSLEQAEKNIFERDLSASLIRPSKKDVVIFTRQLATLIEADVPLVDGLRILVEQINKNSFREVITNLASEIEGGATLSIALAQHPKVFTEFYVSLVRAGEISGKLQTTLLYLADYLERSMAISSKIRGALSYPIFVLSALIVITIILMTTVLPQLLNIIKDAGVVELPLTTRILITMSDFVNHYIIAIIILLVSGIIGVFYYVRTPAGRLIFDDFVIRMPQFGRIARNLYLARIAETLSTLIKAGVPILSSLQIASEVVGNGTYRRILLQARTSVQAGGSISDVLQQYSVFPALVTSMLAIGEKTGKTDVMLENIFHFYKSEAENDIQNIAQLIEPVLILILGVGVGVLVSAVLLPIYSLVGAG